MGRGKVQKKHCGTVGELQPPRGPKFKCTVLKKDAISGCLQNRRFLLKNAKKSIKDLNLLVQMRSNYSRDILRCATVSNATHI